MSEEVLKATVHGVLHDVHVEDGVKIDRRINLRTSSEDVDLDIEDLTQVYQLFGEPVNPDNGYVLRDIVRNLGKVAFNQTGLTVDDFGADIVTNRIDSDDPEQIASAKSVNDLRTQLFNIFNPDNLGDIKIYAPNTSGTGVPTYDPNTKSWTWVPITGKKKVLGNKVILNETEVTADNDIRIYSPQTVPSYTTSSNGAVMMYMGNNKNPIWNPITKILKLNGGNITSIGNDGLYAPLTSGNTGEVLVSQGYDKTPKWEQMSQSSFFINGRKMTDHSYQQYLVGSLKTSNNVVFVNPAYYTSWDDPDDGILRVLNETPSTSKGWFITGTAADIPTEFSDLIRDTSDPSIPSKPLFYQYMENNRVYVKAAYYNDSNKLEKTLIEYDGTAMDHDDESGLFNVIYVMPSSFTVSGNDEHVLKLDPMKSPGSSIKWYPEIIRGVGSFSDLLPKIDEDVSHLAFYEVDAPNCKTVFVVFKGEFEDARLSNSIYPYIFAEYSGEAYNGVEYMSSELRFYAPETSGQSGTILVSGGENQAPTWKKLEFNQDGSVAIDMDTIPTQNSTKSITSGGVWKAINDLKVQINSKSISLKSVASRNIVTPTTMGTVDQQLVSQGSSSVPTWKNKGSYFMSGYVSASRTSVVIDIPVPSILSTDKICVRAGIDSLHSTFVASRMELYNDAGAYIKAVNATNGSSTVSVTIGLLNSISSAYPINVEVTFS